MIIFKLVVIFTLFLLYQGQCSEHVDVGADKRNIIGKLGVVTTEESFSRRPKALSIDENFQ